MAAIQKVSYTHEAIIMWLLENPDKPLRNCADHFGYTQPWLSTVIHSDAFQEQLGKRQQEMMCITGRDIRGKLQVATDIALEGLTRKLTETENGDFLLDATDKLLARMGYGPASARNPGISAAVTVQNITVSSSDLAEARGMIRTIGNGKAADEEYPPRPQERGEREEGEKNSPFLPLTLVPSSDYDPSDPSNDSSG